MGRSADSSVRSIVAALARHWATGLYAMLAFALFYGIYDEATTTRAVTYSGGVDYWEHAAVLRSLMDSPFSPGNPHLTTDSLSPRYMPTFVLTAIVCGALGLSSLSAMDVSACLNVALFLAGAFWFFRAYFDDRRAPLLAFFVLFFSWWDGWNWSNVYQLQRLTGVAAYPSTCALGLTWFCWAATVGALRAGATVGRCIGVGVLAFVVILVHPLTAAMTFAGVGGLALFEPRLSWRTRGLVLGSAVLGALASHFWPYYSPFDVVLGTRGTEEDWVGRAAGQLSEGQLRKKLHTFYEFRGLLKAFGFALPGFYFAASMASRRRHLFVPVGLAATLGVFCMNAFVDIPLGHRFVLLAMMFLHVALVWGCLSFLPGYSEESSLMKLRAVRWGAPATMVALMLFAAHHNLDLAERRHDKLVAGRKTSPVVAYASDVAKIAGPDAVVLADKVVSWPVPAFGPKVVPLHHPNPLVPDWKQRNKDMKRFFSSRVSASDRKGLIARYGATHVLFHRRGAKKLERFLKPIAKGHVIRSGYRLYELE